MAQKGEAVPRPRKKAEYEIKFATRDAEKGWTDFVATARNAATDAWDHLTKHPDSFDVSTCHQMKGDLVLVLINGSPLPRWQFKPGGSVRIWYGLEQAKLKQGLAGTVYLVRVDTGHPNETDPGKNYR